MKSAFVLLPIVASVISGPLAAQWANYPTAGIPRGADGKPNLTAPAPRTPDGKPDLSGLWDKFSPKYGRNIAADLKPGEVQPWAELWFSGGWKTSTKTPWAICVCPWVRRTSPTGEALPRG